MVTVVFFFLFLDLSKFDPNSPKIHQFDQRKLRKWQDFILNSTRDERYKISDKIPYPNLFLPILFIIEAICSRSYHDSGIITDGDLSYGLLLAQLDT